MAWWKYTGGLFNTSDFDRQVYGTHGNDSDLGYPPGLYLIPPNSGRDYIEGNRGSDTLLGGNSSDILVGVDPDRYDAGKGEYDTLWGGRGNDYFVLGDRYETYYQGSGYAVIGDFEQGYDKLVVDGSASDYKYHSSSVSGVGSGAQDTVLTTSSGDWVAVFQDTTFDPLYTSDFVELG